MMDALTICEAAELAATDKATQHYDENLAESIRRVFGRSLSLKPTATNSWHETFWEDQVPEYPVLDLINVLLSNNLPVGMLALHQVYLLAVNHTDTADRVPATKSRNAMLKTIAALAKLSYGESIEKTSKVADALLADMAAKSIPAPVTDRQLRQYLSDGIALLEESD